METMFEVGLFAVLGVLSFMAKQLWDMKNILTGHVFRLDDHEKRLTKLEHED